MVQTVPKIPLPKREEQPEQKQEEQKKPSAFKEAAVSLGSSYMRKFHPTLYKISTFFDEKEEARDTSTSKSFDNVRDTMNRVNNEIDQVNQNLVSIGINQAASVGLLGEILNELRKKKGSGVNIPSIDIPNVGKGKGGKGAAKAGAGRGGLSLLSRGLAAALGTAALAGTFYFGSTEEAGSEEEKALDKMTGPERQKYLERGMIEGGTAATPVESVPLPPERPAELLGEEEKKKRAAAYFENKKAGILDNTELTGQELRDQVNRLREDTKSRFGVSSFPERGSISTIVGPQSSLTMPPVSQADLPSKNATPVAYTPDDTTRSGFMIPGGSGVSANIQQIKEQQAEKQAQQDIFYNAERMIFAADEIQFNSKEDENTRSASVMNLTDAQRSYLAPQMGGISATSPAGTTGPSFGLTPTYGAGAGTAGGTGEIPEHLKTGENGRLRDDQLASIGIGDHKAHPKAAEAFKAMRAAAAADGVNLGVSGAYRTYERQVQLKAEKGGLAATPGKSNHGWGLAFDMSFGGEQNSPGFKWMVANAARFGITGPLQNPYEAWHWTYTGGEDPNAIAQATKVNTGSSGAGEGSSPGSAGGGGGTSSPSSAPKTAAPVPPSPSTGAAIASASVSAQAQTSGAGGAASNPTEVGASNRTVAMPVPSKTSNPNQAGNVEPPDAESRWKDLGLSMGAIF